MTLIPNELRQWAKDIINTLRIDPSLTTDQAIDNAPMHHLINHTKEYIKLTQDLHQLKEGEKEVREILVKIFAIAISGICDAAIINQQEYNASHVIKAVAQLADEHKRLRTKVSEL